MSYLTAEQAMTLAERVQARLNEFGVLAVHMPQVSPGIVRIVADVLEEWQGETEQVGAWPSAPAEDSLADGFHMGYQLAQQKYTRTANGHTNGTVAVRDPAVGTTDFAEFYNAYPTMPDLDGVDLFAEHGAPTGTLAELDEALERELERVDDALAYGGPQAIPTPLDGLQIIAPPTLPVAAAASTASLAATETATNGTLLAYIRKPQTLNDMERVKRQEAELQAVIAALRDMAVDGKMPTKLAYQVNRLRELPSWPTITTRYKIATWRQLAELCGLEYEDASRYAGSGPVTDPDDDATADDADLLDDGSDFDEDPDADEAPAKRKKPAGKREKRERLTRSQEFSRPGPEPKHSVTQPTLEQLIAELQRQAMGNVMVTQAAFNLAKPAVWGSATAQVTRFGLSWEQLREEAGLKPNPRWARTWERTDVAA